MASRPHSFKLESGPVTLYAQLAGILRERIRSGAWPDSEEIPTLEELAAEFAVARVTVRQAMQTLIREGLVSSHRGRRSFVTYTASVDRNPLFTSINLVGSLSPEYSIAIISRDEVPASHIEAPFMGTASGPYMRIRKVDSEGGAPYTLSTNFVSLPLFKRFPKDAEKEVKLTRLVRDQARASLAECRERITVGAADMEEAQRLETHLSAPVARVRRVFTNAKGLILHYAESTYRGDRFGIERDITAQIKN
jgi:GntR family transcriptional regulator